MNSASALFERSKMEHANPVSQKQLLSQARDRFEQTLAIDSENLIAHYYLWQIYTELGESALAGVHSAEHARLRPDDNARDRAVLLARQRSQAADHASQTLAIYDLSPESTPYDR